jgi:hypothetical protein
MKKYLIVLLLPLIILSCNFKAKNNSETSKDEKIQENETNEGKDFWNSLKSLNGKTFEGQLIGVQSNDDFVGKKLVMHVLFADDETILIPFNVGDDRSRTWIFKYKNGRIELKHDHRHQDGSSDKVTMYGGTATNSGSTNVQVFPADEETVQIIPAAFSNVWWVTVNDTSYTYNLRRMGTDRLFTVAFDLKNEIDTPTPSWGWENFGK